MSSQQPRNGNSASNRSPSNNSSAAQNPAMLSRFLYDRTGLPDRLVARSFNAATQNRPNGHEASASELEYYMAQSTSNANAAATANSQAGRTTGR
ncbi:hypothetical protein LI328DRAFT_171533 [Trichoderma asperelloides]|nr:hypothetical protein LI328DRAFT_171533 [Trichoderma asperelloides]